MAEPPLLRSFTLNQIGNSQLTLKCSRCYKSYKLSEQECILSKTFPVLARRSSAVRPVGAIGRSLNAPSLLDLRPYVRNWAGYVERTPGLLSRREFPGAQIVVILEFGPPIQVFDIGQSRHFARYRGGFVAGLHDDFALTQHDGYQCGMHLNLTPIGARLFFDVPLREITRLVVDLPDLLAGGYAVVERLVELPDWEARFDCVEALVRSRLRVSSLMQTGADVKTRQPQAIAHAAAMIESTPGQVELRALAQELGYGQKHMIALFREHVGVAPRLYGRIARFNRLMERLQAGTYQSWADLALDCGYDDQAHLVRDVKAFTGYTPTQAQATLVDFSALAT